MSTRYPLPCYATARLLAALLLAGVSSNHAESLNTAPGTTTKIMIAADQPSGVIGNLYNVGYNGWGDITYPGMVNAFNELGVRFCRLQIDLKALCGEQPGHYRWDYKTPDDQGLNLTQRIKKIIANGWTPLLAFSFHSSEAKLPNWLRGARNDTEGNSWTRYNLDGTKARNGYGDQLDAVTTMAQDMAAHFAAQDLRGLWWESIYEMGGTEPLVEIHHAVAKGVKAADDSAKLVGPATWPGWSVEERFVKPYLRKYGADLLDVVSMHWYASCDHGFWKLKAGLMDGQTIMTMADKELMLYLMNETPNYGSCARSLHVLLEDKTLNPTGKKIGIMYTEVDVNASSYYLRNPENPDWPAYSARADCWQNCNYFGGVWWASVLGHIASTGTEADVFKFNTRNFYGIQEVVPPNRAYRYPVWFAMKLLRDAGGLRAGRQMLGASAKEGGAPLVEAYATGGPADLRIIVINKSFDPQTADITASGLAPDSWAADYYLFDKTRTAQFMGKKPNDQHDGTFQGYPDDDAISQQSLNPVETLPCSIRDKNALFFNVKCPPVSLVILKLKRSQQAHRTAQAMAI